jgi:hypothetical protein
MNESVSLDILEYTDDDFVNKLNADLENIRIGHMCSSNSPVMSANNSDSESGVRKLTFRDVRDSIHKYYDVENNYTTELELLSSYLKNQKQVYFQCAKISGLKMRIIIVPAVIGSAVIIIFSPMINCDYSWSISCINAFVCLLFYIIYYYQFLPAIAFYIQISKQFEKIENITECAVNKYSILEKSVDKIEYVLDHLRELEKKYVDLKEMIVTDVPIEMRYLYSVGYRIPIFSFIKRIEIYKKNLIVKLKDIKNEIRYIEWKNEEDGTSDYKVRMDFLLETKEKIKIQIMDHCKAYGYMEDILVKEIRLGSRCSLWSILLIYMGYQKKMNFDNSVVRSYCESIFADD